MPPSKQRTSLLVVNNGDGGGEEDIVFVVMAMASHRTIIVMHSKKRSEFLFFDWSVCLTSNFKRFRTIGLVFYPSYYFFRSTWNQMDALSRLHFLPFHRRKATGPPRPSFWPCLAAATQLRTNARTRFQPTRNNNNINNILSQQVRD
jgi:hypothetical protein